MAERSAYVQTSSGYYSKSGEEDQFDPGIKVKFTDYDCVFIRIDKLDTSLVLDKETASELSTKISDLLASA